MKRLLFALITIGLVTVTHAAPMGDSVGICYAFKGDKLLSRDICIISNSYGAGGQTTHLQIGKKEYLIETSICYDKKSDSNYECGHSINELDAEAYFRNGFYDTIDDPKFASMYCSVTKDRAIDICHVNK